MAGKGRNHGNQDAYSEAAVQSICASHGGNRDGECTHEHGAPARNHGSIDWPMKEITNLTTDVTDAPTPRKRMARVPLQRWIRRAYFGTALVPLLVVEVVLIAAYLWANHSATQESQESMRALAHEELARISAREASIIDKQLSALSQTVEIFRQQTSRALVTPVEITPEERARYTFGESGVVYHTARDDGGSSLFYSGFVPVGPAQQEKAWRSAQLDPLMRAIAESHPLAAQVYLNTSDSMNRIYPYVETSVMAPRINFPAYNFFYEADERHNPERRVVWTDVYLDPAGKGWLTSCIAPVYVGDTLEAVVGVDVTVASIVESLLDMNLPWHGYGMLVAPDSTIVALPKLGEHDLDLKELLQHAYKDAVRQETFKPDRFKLLNRPDLADLAHRLAGQSNGIASVDLRGAKVAAWSTVPQTDWKLLVLVPESNIYATADTFGDRLQRLGIWAIGGLIAFSALFVALVDALARRMSRSIARPLEHLGTLAQRIGEGEYEQTEPDFVVTELQDTAGQLVEMGHQLGTSNRRLKEAQREAEQARDAALQGSRLKSEFLASVSHEIRTPMGGVLGMLDLLLDTPLAPAPREFATSARDSGMALLQLINDILDFSKIEAGKLELTEEIFTPTKVVEGAADLLAPRAHQKHLELMTFVDPNIPDILGGDPGRLRQVLLNLVGNAVKFTDAGGAVAVRVALEQTTDRHAMLRFSVVDSGIGISAEAHKRLFQPFTQVDGSAARRHGGTGLGLSICKRLVELMGGEIGVQSREGEGSTFWFQVPFKLPEQGAPADDKRHTLPSIRALIIEHRPGSRGILDEYLRSWKAEVTVAASAGEALGALGNARKRGESFDCLLVGLPLGSEAETSLLRALDGEPTLRAIPRVLLAELEERGLEEKARAHGFAAYLTKPIHQSRLFDCLMGIMLGNGDAHQDEGEENGNGAGTAEEALAEATENGTAVRILLAEDNEVNQKVAMHRLRKLGFAADVAENGRDAVDKALSHFYDLILMDIQMPVMDGIEAMREIRSGQAEGEHHSTIVAVTANAMSGDRERFIDMGMDDYISKPYQLGELRILVGRWLAGAGQASS